MIEKPVIIFKKKQITFTFQEGAIREVLEETGIIFEPSTLLIVEVARFDWYRFTFTGRVTGILDILLGV